MRKNYNFTRHKLYLPEYGRHIHQMVDSLLEIEDRTERTRQAKAVIAVMGNINPTLRDTEEFKHKLWDHLFIMSDFKLDVDSPYLQPSRQDFELKPKKLPYPQSRVMFKHYGKHAQRFVRHIVEAQHRADVSQQILDVARYMRTKSYEFNHEHPKNESIVRDLQIMSAGELQVDLTEVTNMRSEYRQHPQSVRNQKGKKQHAHPHAHPHPHPHPHQHQHSSQRKMQKGGMKSGQRHSAHK